MATSQVVILAVVVTAVVLAAVAAWFWMRRQRSNRLQERFGPEYEQVVRDTGDRGKGEKMLEHRQERVEKLQIRSLSEDERERFAEAWDSAQAEFVDDPGGAIRDADVLVGEAMQARGYPVGQFEQRTADISVDHPQVVNNYRAAHAIAGQAARGDATTDDLRQGLLHYRALFEELLESTSIGQTKRTGQAKRIGRMEARR